MEVQILIIAALLWYFGVFGFVGGGAPASTFNVNPPATVPAGGLPSGGLPSIAPAS